MNDRRQDAIRRSEALARFLDDSIPIPGTGFRVGWDFIIGLIPGVGDLLASLFSTYIVAQALDQGVAKATIFRMVWNILVETVLGAVPFLGDLFDAAWKSNVKNARLLEAALRDQTQLRKKDGLFMVLVLSGLVLLAVLAGAAGIAVLSALRDWIVNIS